MKSFAFIISLIMFVLDHFVVLVFGDFWTHPRHTPCDSRTIVVFDFDNVRNDRPHLSRSYIDPATFLLSHFGCFDFPLGIRPCRHQSAFPTLVADAWLNTMGLHGDM